MVRSGSRPSSRRIRPFSPGEENTGAMGIPVTWIVSGGIPSATMWTFVSSHATKYQSTPRYSHMAWRSKSVITTPTGMSRIFFRRRWRRISAGRKWVQTASRGRSARRSLTRGRVLSQSRARRRFLYFHGWSMAS